MARSISNRRQALTGDTHTRNLTRQASTDERLPTGWRYPMHTRESRVRLTDERRQMSDVPIRLTSLAACAG